jgi:hypothetical protein
LSKTFFLKYLPIITAGVGAKMKEKKDAEKT